MATKKEISAKESKTPKCFAHINYADYSAKFASNGTKLLKANAKNVGHIASGNFTVNNGVVEINYTKEMWVKAFGFGKTYPVSLKDSGFQKISDCVLYCESGKIEQAKKNIALFFDTVSNDDSQKFDITYIMMPKELTQIPENYILTEMDLQNGIENPKCVKSVIEEKSIAVSETTNATKNNIVEQTPELVALMAKNRSNSYFCIG
jgi:hypothetical protein